MVLDVHAASRRQRRRAMGHWVVLVNGIDVTASAFYADDRRGLVRCFRRDSTGRLVVAAGRVVREELRGRVTIRRVSR